MKSQKRAYAAKKAREWEHAEKDRRRARGDRADAIAGFYDRERASGCATKRRYFTRGAAVSEAMRCMEERPGDRLRAYRCHRCGGWHITSKKKHRVPHG